MSGLTGAIFASLALALVLIYRATDVVNFSQGEMATFATYIAWSLMDHGLSYWPAFALTLVLAFIGGAAVERVVIRPVEHRPEIVIVIVTIGLLILLNGLTGWIWGAEVKAFDSPFPNETWDVGGVAISVQDIGTLGVCLLTVLALWAFFRFTTLGLVMRAVANNPTASRLVGVRVGWMLALGWGLAAVLGAVAGMMAAPTLFLDPTMMLIVLIYAFAAAVLGDRQPLGAVVGGLTLGVLLNLLGAYVDFVGSELRLPTALLVLLVVLLIRRRGCSATRWCGGYESARAVDDPEVRVVWRGGRRDRASACFMGEFRLSQFTFVGLYFVALLGLNILTGYNGQISLAARRVHGHRRLRQRTADPRSPRPRALPAGPAGVDPAGRRHDSTRSRSPAWSPGSSASCSASPLCGSRASRSRWRRSRWQSRCRPWRSVSTPSPEVAAG